VSDFGAILRAAKASGQLGPLEAAIPYAAYLGVRFALAEGALVATLPYQPKLVGNPVLPALHGGVIGAFLEHTAIIHLMWDSDAEEIPKTIDVTVHYLRSGRPLDTHAAAGITRHGRRVANVRAEAWQDDRSRPIAIIRGHFLLR